MSDTLFIRIINGEIPCHKIYEDETTFAFLDINPIQSGHVLVIPKTPAETVWELTPLEYSGLMSTVYKLAQHLQQTLSAEKVGVKIEGLEVPHAHVHLIPFTTAEEFNAVRKKATNDELVAIAKKLAI